MRFLKRKIVLLIALTAIGCGNEEDNVIDEIYSKAVSLCLARNICLGNDEVTREMCRDVIESQFELAELGGCENITNDYLECLVKNSSCTNEGKYTAEGYCSDQEELAEDCRKGRL